MSPLRRGFFVGSEMGLFCIAKGGCKLWKS
nr:MAG TPA: hypothetical protein [Caudoviricetes sp.]